MSLKKEIKDFIDYVNSVFPYLYLIMIGFAGNVGWCIVTKKELSIKRILAQFAMAYMWGFLANTYAPPSIRVGAIISFSLMGYNLTKAVMITDKTKSKFGVFEKLRAIFDILTKIK